jgi:hypothetical protein
MKKPFRLTVHQCLHGYEDGHRLLASSCKLSRDSEREMLALTDLSGSSGGAVFEPYFTGYPLSNGEFYVLTQTWLALEMQRPGCVWSHSFLFTLEQIAAIDKLPLLFPYFTRPSSPLDLSSFRQSRDVELSPFDATSWHHSGSELLLESLFSAAGNKVAIAIETHEVGVAIIDDAWSSLWTGARTEFSFCTYVKAPQSIAGKSLDAQFFLVKDSSSVMRRLQSKGIDVVAARPVAIPKPRFFTMQRENLVNAFPNSLSGMGSFYRLLHHVGSIGVANALEVVEFLAKEFPKPIDGVGVKAALLGANNVLGLKTSDVWFAIVTSGHADAFDVYAIGFTSVDHLWDDLPETIRLLNLVFASESSTAKNIGQMIVNAMPEDKLSRIAIANFPILAEILKVRPELWASVELWKCDPITTRAMINLIEGDRSVAQAYQHVLIENAVRHGFNDGWDVLLTALGNESFVSSLAAMSRSRCTAFPDDYCKVLVHRETSVLEWIKNQTDISIEMLISFIGLLGRRTLDESQPLFMSLAPLIVSKHQELSPYPEVRFLAFVMGLRFDRFDVVLTLLPRVHEDIASGSVSDSLWHSYSNEFPSLDYWSGWDRCKQVRRAIAAKYAYQKWPLSSVELIKTQEGLLFGIFREMKRLPSSKDAARRFKSALQINFQAEDDDRDEEDFID